MDSDYPLKEKDLYETLLEESIPKSQFIQNNHEEKQLEPICAIHQPGERFIEQDPSLPPELYNYQQSVSFLEFNQENPESNHSQKLLPQQVQSKKEQNQESLKIQVSKIKHTKNSNSIKKLGRIIMDHIKEYQIRDNIGLKKMLKSLDLRSRTGRKEQNKRDRFNTHHLKALVNSGDEELDRFNLKVTHRVLSQHCRYNVMTSHQISTDNKLVYLNTLKCSVLRSMSKSLVSRLEMPQF